MADKVIKLKRSSVADSVPSTNVLEEGEIAVNLAEGKEKIFIKNSNQNVVTLIDRSEIADIKTQLQTIIERLNNLENQDKVDILSSEEYSNLETKDDNTLYVIK